MTTPNVPAATPSSQHRDLTEVIALVLAHRRSLIAVPAVTAVLTAVVVLLWPVSFTATATFVPSSNSAASDVLGASGLLGSIAANLHIGTPGALTNSPQYFNELIVSRPILERAVWTAYQIEGDSAPQTLISLMDLADYDSATATTYALRTLRTSWISQSVDDATGIATLEVTTDDPGLSAQVAQRLLDLLNDYNLHLANTTARQEREFVGQRLQDATARLRTAEDSLRAFQLANRATATSPTLQLEASRLQRQVDVENQVYLALRQQYETARIAEVRDTPVLSVIEPPSPPALHDRRYGLLKVLFAAFGAGFATLVVIIVRGYWDAMPDTAGRRAVQIQLRETKGWLTRLARRKRT